MKDNESAMSHMDQKKLLLKCPIAFCVKKENSRLCLYLAKSGSVLLDCKVVRSALDGKSDD